VEFLDEYNSGKKYVTPQAQRWFGYKSMKVKTRMDESKVYILSFYPYLSGIINWVAFFGLLYFLILKGWRTNPDFKKLALLAGILWLINAGFTIIASSAALRFQAFPIILTTTLALLLVDWMVQLMKSMKTNEKNMSTLDNYRPEVVA
jgi:hypothetical protein